MPTTELMCPNCHKPFVPAVQTYKDDYIEIDESQFLVLIKGQRASLTATEHRLLACLVANPNRILTHRQLLSSVWGWEYQDDIDYIRIHVYHLRQKIEPNPAKPKYIVSENGIGYRFNTDK